MSKPTTSLAGRQTDNQKMTTTLCHVAFIMDGNRRWAKRKKISAFKGHLEGQERIEPLIDAAIKLGIPYLTFWAFSTENWQRDKKEVEFLLNMFRSNLNKKVDNFHKKNVRIKIIGNIALFPSDIQKQVAGWMEKTKNNKVITVNVALSYGGRDEIVRAIKKIRNPKFEIRNLTKEKFSELLDTVGQPDPDLIIRTGGVMRLSGFLMWQSEYSEFYFAKVLWPDFTPTEFEKALMEFNSRQRRFGR